MYLSANETTADLESLGWELAKDNATYRINISNMTSLENCQGYPLDYVTSTPEKFEDCPQIRGFAYSLANVAKVQRRTLRGWPQGISQFSPLRG